MPEDAALPHTPVRLRRRPSPADTTAGPTRVARPSLRTSIDGVLVSSRGLTTTVASAPATTATEGNSIAVVPPSVTRRTERSNIHLQVGVGVQRGVDTGIGVVAIVGTHERVGMLRARDEIEHRVRALLVESPARDVRLRP